MQSFQKYSPSRWIPLLGLILLILSSSVILVSGHDLSQAAAEGQAIFNQNCSACHTIGGGSLIGPDLQGVTQRREIDWLQRMISAPEQLIANQDPIVMLLLTEYNNLQMPNLGLSQNEVQSIIAFLENPESGGQSQPAALPESGSQQSGRQIFIGAIPLTNGGPNCIACHSTADLSFVGGGSLGPDLTQVAQRLGDPGLASALKTLPFPTMQGVYTNRLLTHTEQADLYAYFQSLKSITPAGTIQPVWFWGAGFTGAILLFGLLSFYWPRQRRNLAERLRDQTG